MSYREPVARGVVVRVRCSEAGGFHDRKGSTEFGPFRRGSDGEWRELFRYGTRARRAAERRPTDPATNPETGEVDVSRLREVPRPGRNARPTDLNPGLRSRATRFVRANGELVSEQDESRVDEALRYGTRTTSAGRTPAAAQDSEASHQLAFKCGCGLSRTLRAEDAANIFDRLAAAGENAISLLGLIRLHERRDTNAP